MLMQYYLLIQIVENYKMTEKLNIKQLKPISTDVNLGTSDALLPTQNAVKTYVDTADSGLQTQINALSGRGRFLSIWNCATGLAETNPPESPYTYKSGDYFIVGTVSSATPAVNYRPDGATYTTGVASTTVETNEVKVDDTYVYDGTNWKLQANSQRQYTFSGITGSPYDNNALGNALNGKVDETSTADQVYGTDNNGNQTTYNITDFGAVDDVKVNNVSVVTSKIANIDLTSYLQNTATATDAISVYGTANTTWTNGINIGAGSRITSTNGIAIGVDSSADVNAVGLGRDADAGVRGTAIGAYAKTSADTGIAIGCWNSAMHNAVSSAKGAYQFGVGTNNTARTLNVGWYDDSVSPSTFRNYQMLDGNTGLIPDARISTNITRTADLATVATSGDYNDLTNKPTIPAAQVNSDWDAVSGVAQILNKPTLGTMAAENASDYTKTSGLATVATTGDYDDLLNKPTIPAAQVNSDWNAVSGVAQILNKPTLSAVATSGAYSDLSGTPNLATVATSGDYDDLLNKPTIPAAQVNSDWNAASGVAQILNKPTIPTVNNSTITITQGGVTKGSFTLNQASGDTIELDAGGGSALPDPTGHTGELLTNDGTNASWTSVIDCGTMS